MFKANNSGSPLRNLPGSSAPPPRTSAMPLMMQRLNPQPRRSRVCWPPRWSSPPRSSLCWSEWSQGRPGPVRPTGWTGLIWTERIPSHGGTSSTSAWRFSWPSCPHSPPLRSLTETGSRWERFLSFDHQLTFSLSQPVMGAVIEGLTGSNDRAEVNVMAKQAAEVFGLVVSLAQALATSMSQRSLYWELESQTRDPTLSCDKQKFFQYCSFWVIKQGSITKLLSEFQAIWVS